ncbi:MAG: AMP-binding protein [Pseudomonadales bacterium]|jgi:malonyl-CoA/methylmalonyl-CoA synthetase|nr:AMP-binding protein [Pseudomonadales bacterium]
MSLYRALLDAAERRPERIALHGDDGRALTHAALHEEASRIAGALREAGVGPGDRVTVQVEKSFSAVALYLAVLRAGAVFQPLNSAYTEAELAYFVGDAEPRVLVCDPARAEALAPIAAEHDARLRTLAADGRGTLIDAARAATPAPPVPGADDALAAVLYTSGTTGRSKGAMLTHGNLLSNARTLRRCWGWRDDDVLVHALPIHHVHGLFVALHCALLEPGTLWFLERFDAERVLARLPEATVYMGVPTHYVRLLAEPGLDRARCASMRLFVSGSAPLRPETFAAFEARTGHRILERYGMTEAGMITSNPLDGDRVPGSVGYPLPEVELRLRTPEGDPVEEGGVGVLEVRGPNVFPGYWRLPERTASEFRDGWFVTGDLATRDPDGRVHIVGRHRDLIISGGLNVYPKEIEAELDALPGVLESAVIGVPHPDFGEAVVAVAVTGEGWSGEEDARGRLRERLAAFKVPKRIVPADALPRNAMGKVQKNLLREAHSELFADAPSPG